MSKTKTKIKVKTKWIIENLPLFHELTGVDISTLWAILSWYELLIKHNLITKAKIIMQKMLNKLETDFDFIIHQSLKLTKISLKKNVLRMSFKYHFKRFFQLSTVVYLNQLKFRANLKSSFKLK